jgi:hypothetical protein
MLQGKRWKSQIIAGCFRRGEDIADVSDLYFEGYQSIVDGVRKAVKAAVEKSENKGNG